jgi:hypothetical protein
MLSTLFIFPDKNKGFSSLFLNPGFGQVQWMTCFTWIPAPFCLQEELFTC